MKKNYESYFKVASSNLKYNKENKGKEKIVSLSTELEEFKFDKEVIPVDVFHFQQLLKRDINLSQTLIGVSLIVDDRKKIFWQNIKQISDIFEVGPKIITSENTYFFFLKNEEGHKLICELFWSGEGDDWIVDSSYIGYSNIDDIFEVVKKEKTLIIIPQPAPIF